MMNNLKYFLTLFILPLASITWAQTLPSEQPVIKAKTINSKKKSSHKAVVDTVKIYVQSPKATEPQVTDANFNFYDDFKDNRNNWNIGNDPYKEINIIGGKLRLKNNTQSRAYHCGQTFSIDNNKDFSLTITTKWIEGTANSGFGFYYCSNTLFGSYNTFEISSGGSYVISYVENNGDWKLLKSWTKSDYINTGNIPNILSIKKQGSYLSFYINDHQIEKFPFEGGYGNAFGCRVCDPQTVDFDNFSITGTKN